MNKRIVGTVWSLFLVMILAVGCGEPCAVLAQLCEKCPIGTDRQKVMQVECRATVQIGIRDACSTAVVVYQPVCTGTNSN
ncbi:MAG: hypothetical protein EP343_28360 [Deltaproteobacteria bacterium]|nr:MAG: hypothetical protein EP343_28360 [Deltaproteobacteria bacterium]